MVRNIILTIFLLISYNLIAQLSDDFSDGDFSHTPAWSGNINLFTVKDQMLKLNDTGAGNAFLSTPNSVMNTIEWNFWVRLAFTPTDNNHVRIYLVSDSEDLSSPLNGYYIRIGKDGAAGKRIFFYRQTGSEHTELLAGITNLATLTNNLIRIKVTRDNEGRWKFFADPTGDRAFLAEGEITDNNHCDTRYFGVHCFYTSGNAGKFYFDDFYIGEPVIDTLPPMVERIKVPSPNVVQIHFSESVDKNTARQCDIYFVNKDAGNPETVEVNDEAGCVATLTFTKPFIRGEIYNLRITGVCDLSANCISNYTTDFSWYTPAKNDIVFTEIMVNPQPNTPLPDYEYIELYNRSSHEAELSGWVLQHGTTLRYIPDVIIPPGGYLLFCCPDAVEELDKYATVVSIPSLSCSALTNAGNLLLLLNREMEPVNYVRYSDSWYQNKAKAGGGWSLEKIDPENLCGEESNWWASTDPSGGTPGRINSVNANNPDITNPSLLRCGYTGSSRLTLYFSEPMDPATLENTEGYNINNGIGSPSEVILSPPDHRQVDLVLANELQPGTQYLVEVMGDHKDCAGNRINQSAVPAGCPEEADSADVVINEILFNPFEGGEKYIELYNRSNKVVDLKDFTVCSWDTLEDIPLNIKGISEVSRLMFPGEFVVLTPRQTGVQSKYLSGEPSCFMNMTLSTMGSYEGIVTLADKGHRIIDRVAYDETMHYPLLAIKKGVSLERVDYNRPASDRTNWHSAAATVGYGTPGYVNSQYVALRQDDEEIFTIEPPVFSPDNDGADDVLNISWQLIEPGLTANIIIYDSRGRLIKNLAHALTLSIVGTLSWDGTTENSTKADMGIYVIFIELYEPGGVVKSFKKTGVLAGR